jgi:hypothetical protein
MKGRGIRITRVEDHGVKLRGARDRGTLHTSIARELLGDPGGEIMPTTFTWQAARQSPLSRGALVRRLILN